MIYAKEKEVAIAAVNKAVVLCKQVHANLVTSTTIQKGDKSPVTVADFGSQALICHHLSQHFLEDSIVGEEDSATLQTAKNVTTLNQIVHYVQQTYPKADSKTVCNWIDRGNGSVADRYWTLDPIDGTKGFLRKEQYAIALALIEMGQIKVSVLACPALPFNVNDPQSAEGVIFVAVRGQGAMMASLDEQVFKPIQVASNAEPTQYRFVESVEAAHANHSLQQTIAQAVGINYPSLRMDSQAKYGAVARGDAVLYLRLPRFKQAIYYEKIWDHAAGTLIVEEAGGRVTDIFGNPLDFATDYKMRHNKGVVVTNGFLHLKVIEALQQVDEL